MQFILPNTPNLVGYFGSLSLWKKVVFLATLIFFITGGSLLALGVYAFFSPASARVSSDSPIASPISFFGKIAGLTPPGVGDEKTVASPLNGVLYTPLEAASWQGRRPMAVMVNNHSLARPQSGLSQADIVYEAVAEGGISRFLAVFHSKIPEKVGPIRSARKYYVDFAKENDAWYGHWGGASTANEANVYDYMRQIFVSSIDAMWAASQAFWRDFSRDVPSEHTGYASTAKLYETAYRRYPDQPREWREAVGSWVFKEDAPEAERSESQTIEFNFWDLPDFAVTWQYDKAGNVYRRSQGGEVQVDAENNETLTAKSVIVLFMDERYLNDGKGHLLYKTTGSGEGWAFLDGQQFEITWSRRSVSARTQFLVGSKGETSELKLNRGQIWIEVLPTGSALTVN